MAQVGRLVKESLVDEVARHLKHRPNFFVASVTRLPAAETDVLRQKLFTSQARLVVVKRRLGQRAVDGLKITGLADLLEGSIGFILSGEDVVQTAKLLTEFRKSREEQITLRGAVIDGQVLDKIRVEQLAQLPPRPALLAQVVGAIESPIADVIFTIERLIGDLGWIIEQAAAQRPPAHTPPEATPAAAPPEPSDHRPET